MKLPWFVAKPFRWVCHQTWGEKKGEAMFLALSGPVGQWYSLLTPDEVEAALARIPEIDL